ncbi:hypothetical protein BJ508DRAFT_10511 [Ascobolus immersus RN42]|uniref:Uncharacterized protein n=1 Tax=Ascobolus immersus RN42 TaxID=1160509 RepID=A0A3N4HQZ7_ASCIM|nr:hypothetical protein BJ508DRAFT_10511 [Ascobolus immersus RN42]
MGLGSCNMGAGSSSRRGGLAGVATTPSFVLRHLDLSCGERIGQAGQDWEASSSRMRGMGRYKDHLSTLLLSSSNSHHIFHNNNQPTKPTNQASPPLPPLLHILQPPLHPLLPHLLTSTNTPSSQTNHQNAIHQHPPRLRPRRRRPCPTTRGPQHRRRQQHPHRYLRASSGGGCCCR